MLSQHISALRDQGRVLWRLMDSRGVDWNSHCQPSRCHQRMVMLTSWVWEVNPESRVRKRKKTAMGISNTGSRLTKVQNWVQLWYSSGKVPRPELNWRLWTHGQRKRVGHPRWGHQSLIVHAGPWLNAVNITLISVHVFGLLKSVKLGVLRCVVPYVESSTGCWPHTHT